MNSIDLSYLDLSQETEIEKDYYRRFLFYKPNLKQRLFHAAGKYAQERLITGGNRGGKTYGSEIELGMHLTGNYPDSWEGHRYDHPIRSWVLGATATVIAQTLQRDLLGDKEQGIKGIIHESLIVDKRKAGNSSMYRDVYVSHVSGGVSKIEFRTYEEGREKLQSSKVEFVLMDEEPPMNLYNEIKMRTASTTEGFHGMLAVSATPMKGYTEFFMYFMDGRHPQEVQDSRWHAHLEWADAEHLPAAEQKRLIAGMSPHEIEARTKGIPWMGSGLVYPVPESVFLCDPFIMPDYWPKVFGIDFGWHNPTAVLFAAHDIDNDVVYLYAEYAVSEKTPTAHANALMQFDILKIPGVYDPAGRGSQQADGKTLVGLYIEAGLRNMAPAKNSKEEGILTVLQRMQAGQIKVFSTLTKTLSELRKYSRDDKGIPNKKDDHLMDCMRYIVMSGLSLAKPMGQRPGDYSGTNYRSTRRVGEASWMGL